MTVFITFETGFEDRFSETKGPYPFVQITYDSIRVGENGDEFIANFIDGWWVTENGEKWSDVIIAAM